MIEHSPTKKLTVSGGEPLLQAEALGALLKRLKLADFDLALYTGCQREEVPDYIMEHLDYINVGEYVDALRTTITPYIGSSNQVFKRVQAEDVRDAHSS